jgi:hypothetical protein
LARLKELVVHLLLASACLCAHAQSVSAGFATTADQLMVYNANQTIVDQTSTLATGGLALPGVQDTHTPGRGNLPLLLIESGQRFQPTRPIPLVLAAVDQLMQGGMHVENVVGVDLATGNLGFWSDADASNPTDVLAAFQAFGIGGLYNTVLVEVLPTAPVDVSAYVNLPLSASFLSDGGVPEASTFAMWLLLGGGGLACGWWWQRRAAGRGPATADR